MTTLARWERVRAIFHSALEQPALERAASLREMCPDDEDLRREVESLLEADAAAANFLSGPDRDAAREFPSAGPGLKAGDRLGSFAIAGQLGAGGMGEVYLAHDERLKRDVAIKILPSAVSADSHRLARFEREAHALAALNHPHIATIHSIEHVDGVVALVLELVEGPTLADRLTAGALSWSESLAIARDLAGALEAAHAKGVIHRDVKPANVKVTSDGVVKLLDFGLAKIDQSETVERRRDIEATSAADTADGIVVGTGAYMSPEQAAGRAVDKRADIWAFGCLLYEMLAGRRAFAGDTLPEIIAAITEKEPDWDALPLRDSPILRRLLRRCLEKEPRRRLHDIADARIDVEEILAAPEPAAAASDRPTRRLAGVIIIASALAVAPPLIAVGWWFGARGAPPIASDAPTRFAWSLPQNATLSSPPAVSPNGRMIAYAATDAAGTRLFVRALNSVVPVPLVGTAGAKQPFWSPDSSSLGYFADGRLMRVGVDGGTPTAIGPAPDARGGTWSHTGTIIFAPVQLGAGLLRVPASGGTPEPATRLDVNEGDNSHQWPVFLPDGVHFLYFVRAVNDDRRGIYVARIDRAAAVPGRAVLRSESDAAYVSIAPRRGLLIAPANGSVAAREFDVSALAVVGKEFTLDVTAAGKTPFDRSMVSASAGVLTAVSSPWWAGPRLGSVDRDGRDLRFSDTRQPQNWIRLSPDGQRLARQRIDPLGASIDLWVDDLRRGTETRATAAPEAEGMPVWSPDGSRLVYAAGEASAATDVTRLTIAAADGTGIVRDVPCPAPVCEPTDWSEDGRTLIVNARDRLSTRAARLHDVWTIPTAAGEEAQALLAGSFVERDARLSPDGRFIAYVSEESGRPEVSIQRLFPARARTVISVAGGEQPVWRRDQSELFFVDLEGRLRSVAIETSIAGDMTLGTPAPLAVPPIGTGHWGTQYDVSRDGRRIYFLDRRQENPPNMMEVILDWRSLLR